MPCARGSAGRSAARAAFVPVQGPSTVLIVWRAWCLRVLEPGKRFSFRKEAASYVRDGKEVRDEKKIAGEVV